MPQLESQSMLQSGLCAQEPEVRPKIPFSGSFEVRLPASREPAIHRQLDLVRRFHEQLASYQANYGTPLEPGNVSVSFQSLIDGEQDEVGELTGMVAL